MEPFLEDMKRHLRLGLEAEALEICQGMVLGLYQLSQREGAPQVEEREIKEP